MRDLNFLQYESNEVETELNSTERAIKIAFKLIFPPLETGTTDLFSTADRLEREQLLSVMPCGAFLKRNK